MRGGAAPTPPNSYFVDNGNGTITDTRTSLVWAALPADQNGDGTYDVLDWQGAIAHCTNLTDYGGRSDWRLPNRHELQSIVDYQLYNPAIDLRFFPATMGTFWTSTTSASSGASAYTVDFTSGSVGYADKILC